ncbi:type III secretion system chaperone family protein [Marinoscillum furvescens]|uniref:Sensory transduction regulator n=1 Tax=Marinoscillum furvescens DSM 4134 TaxID=1122208 RepID=A0A3D9LH39_MARFU|nr:hypothetical protein [Marinoscillum furvescens]REE05711.1 hypothetical protein C7460_101229 [Marinoscillum furvescens DSM 4134]
MNLKEFSEKFANKIGGDYNEYDDNHSIFIVPLPDERFQTVIAKLVNHEKYNRKAVQVTSKVCRVTENIDYATLLEASKDFVHTNFIVEDDFLKVDTSIFLEHTDDKLIEEAIKEVAYTADEWEFKITGQDNF